jgi:L-cystine uptake protein TcyP (sodium:dicarboxylate symporter family)
VEAAGSNPAIPTKSDTKYQKTSESKVQRFFVLSWLLKRPNQSFIYISIMNSWLKNYKGILLLISGIITGSIAGAVLGDKVKLIKPIGDIFLNLLFTAVVPLVFFAITSAISGLNKSQKLGKY